MKLLGSYRSPYVRKALVVASETGLAGSIDIELHSVHMAAHVPEVMALNPLNKLPTLVLGDGTTLFDSLVICDFLAWKADRQDLLPNDREARFPILRRHALANGLIDLAILRLVEDAKPPERQWTSLIEAGNRKISAVLDYLERDENALRREGCTLGTLTAAVALNYLDFRFSTLDWRKGRPQLSRWHRDFTARPSLSANAFEDEMPALAGRIR